MDAALGHLIFSIKYDVIGDQEHLRLMLRYSFPVIFISDLFSLPFVLSSTIALSSLSLSLSLCCPFLTLNLQQCFKYLCIAAMFSICSSLSHTEPFHWNNFSHVAWSCGKHYGVDVCSFFYLFIYFYSSRIVLSRAKENDTQEEKASQLSQVALVMNLKMCFPARLMTIGSAAEGLGPAVRGSPTHFLINFVFNSMRLQTSSAYFTQLPSYC